VPDFRDVIVLLDCFAFTVKGETGPGSGSIHSRSPILSESCEVELTHPRTGQATPRRRSPPGAAFKPILPDGRAHSRSSERGKAVGAPPG
jgi:hypothetical protein